jgi:hypothetical protein
MTEIVLSFFFGTLLIAVTAFAPYARYEMRGRRHWMLVPRAPEAAERGPYRSGDVVAGHLDAAPPLVRLTALSCFLFGQVVVPMSLVCLPLFLVGVGFLGLPLALVTGGIWRIGPRLLRRDPGVIARAKDLARASLVVHGGIAGVAIASAAMVTDPGWRRFCLLLVPYAALWIGQALLLRATVRRHTADFGEPPPSSST